MSDKYVTIDLYENSMTTILRLSKENELLKRKLNILMPVVMKIGTRQIECFASMYEFMCEQALIEISELDEDKNFREIIDEALHEYTEK